MKKALKYILSIIGLISVVLFCVSATADFNNVSFIVSQPYAKPFNLVFLGIGLIGLGSFLKNRELH